MSVAARVPSSVAAWPLRGVCFRRGPLSASHSRLAALAARGHRLALPAPAPKVRSVTARARRRRCTRLLTWHSLALSAVRSIIYRLVTGFIALTAALDHGTGAQSPNGSWRGHARFRTTAIGHCPGVHRTGLRRQRLGALTQPALCDRSRCPQTSTRAATPFVSRNLDVRGRPWANSAAVLVVAT